MGFISDKELVSVDFNTLRKDPKGSSKDKVQTLNYLIKNNPVFNYIK